MNHINRGEAMNNCKVWKVSVFNLMLILASFVFISNSIAQHLNVQVGNFFPEKTYYPNEPSIAINPKNTEQMIATTNGPVHNYYFSYDGGISWTRAGNYSFDLGLWGDPCVIADTSGYFHFFHLDRLYSQGILLLPDRIWHRRISCDQMAGGWTDSSYTGLNEPKMQDKEWATCDPFNQNLYVLWTEFDVYGSPAPNDHSNILFSKSTDDGLTWSQPLRINEVSGDCLDDDNTVEGAVPTTGPNNEIYVSWAGPDGIIFDRSLDYGETWLDEDIIISDMPGGWAFDIPGISRCGGMPVTVCDISGGPYNGNIYVNWSDQRNGTNDTDIWLSKSTDGGDSWSPRIRVNNDPPGKHQMFHWLALDQSNGFLYCVFYDRRNYNDNQTDVYIALSTDGGESFYNQKISETPFIPYGWRFLGDYSNIAAVSDVIRPIWARMDTGYVSVWTAIIDPSILRVEDSRENQIPTEFELSFAYPNPFNPVTNIKYSVPNTSHISLVVFNTLGEKISTLVDEEKYPGNYTVLFDGSNLSSGIYFYIMKAGNFIETKKLVLLK